MLSTSELLDLARKRQGDVSDYRIAKLLEVDQATVSGYRSGKSQPKNAVAMRLAALCGLNPVEVVSWVNLERFSGGEERELWQSILASVRIHNTDEDPLIASVRRIPLPSERPVLTK